MAVDDLALPCRCAARQHQDRAFLGRHQNVLAERIPREPIDLFIAKTGLVRGGAQSDINGTNRFGVAEAVVKIAALGLGDAHRLVLAAARDERAIRRKCHRAHLQQHRKTVKKDTNDRECVRAPCAPQGRARSATRVTTARSHLTQAA